MNKKTYENISEDRKKYLAKKKKQKIVITTTQISILIGFILIWEILARLDIIDGFLTSQPSRVLTTITEMSSNNLLMHLFVTCYETVVGFLLGTITGTLIACLLWWSNYASKVFEPFLVILNSLPKVALRSNYNSLGRCRYACNNHYGTCNFINCNNFRNVKWIYEN